MKNIFKSLLLWAAVTCFMPSMPFGLQTNVLSAQTAPTRTTLAAAMAAGARTMTVTSATGFTATGGTSACPSTQCFVLVENDLRQVLSVSGTLISLGPAKGAGVGHVNGSTVVFGSPGVWQTGTAGVGAGSTGVFPPSLPTGACTRANQGFLPMFVPASSTGTVGGTIDCLGGQWVVGTLPDAPQARALALAKNIDTGATAYSSVGTNTTDVATVEWLTSIWVPQTGYVTGIKFLCGNTCTTDKAVAILRDKTGNVIANAATAGVTVSGANTFQTQAFTTPVFVTGPALYFIGIQGNGTAAGFIETIATATYTDVITGQLTGGTFGTIVNPATMPTTFTANQGPVAYLYY